MTDAIADAPVRANRAPEATTIAAGYSAMQTPASPSGQELDEHTVARVAAHLLRAVIAADERAKGECASMYGSELAKQALGQLEVLITCTSDTDASAAFLAAAAMTAGALAYERGARPENLEFNDKLEQVFQVLDSANWGYSTEQAPCEALAVGLQAGANQFREQPRAPKRRVEEEAGDDTLNHRQQQTVLQTLAGYVSTLEQVLMAAQTSEDEYQTGVLIDSAVLLARYVGGLADNASGGGVCGNHDHWNYGPNFVSEGKAGAA